MSFMTLHSMRTEKKSPKLDAQDHPLLPPDDFANSRHAVPVCRHRASTDIQRMKLYRSQSLQAPWRQCQTLQRGEARIAAGPPTTQAVRSSWRHEESVDPLQAL